MPFPEPNPAEKLLKIPLDQTLASVHQIYAMNRLILENQARILSVQTGRAEAEIMEEFERRLDVIFNGMIEALPKTI